MRNFHDEGGGDEDVRVCLHMIHTRVDKRVQNCMHVTHIWLFQRVMKVRHLLLRKLGV